MAADRFGPRGNYGPTIDDDEALPPSPDGWVAVARAMRFHPLVGCGQPVAPGDTTKGGAWSRYEAWQDLIMECRYSEGRVWNGGRMMDLQPGQLLGAISFLADRWNWTPKTVRTFLDRLEAEGMISTSYASSGKEKNAAISTDINETERHKGKQEVNNDVHEGKHKGKQQGKQARVLTICNYGSYQVLPEQPRQAQGQAQGQLKGKQNAKKGQHYKEETRVTNKQETYPPTPQCVPPATRTQDDLQAGRHERQPELDLDVTGQPPETQADHRRKRGERSVETRHRNAEVDDAFAMYNRAAEHFGFARCEVLSDERRTRLRRRLDSIGGIDLFRRALWEIGKNDFLMGRTTPRPGQHPFRLTFDRLLQTDGGLGDVLASLIEQGGGQSQPGAVPPPPPDVQKTWGWWRDPATLANMRGVSVSAWRNAIDRVKPNGTWPWWHLGPAPGDPECLVPEEIVRERGWVEVYKGQLTHQ